MGERDTLTCVGVCPSSTSRKDLCLQNKCSHMFPGRFYCRDIRAYDILFGDITRPAQAEDLYEILDSFTEKYESEGQRVNARRAAREQKKASVMLGFSIFLSSCRGFLHIDDSAFGSELLRGLSP